MLLTFSNVAFAQNRANVASIFFGDGFYHFAAKRRLDNVNVPLLGFGYNFTEHWAIEALLSRFNTDVKKSENDTRTIQGELGTIDAVYHFISPTMQLIEPFILAGVGFTGLNPNRHDAHDEGNMNAGVGVQMFINRWIALRLEGRDFYTFVGGKNDYMIDGGINILIDLCRTCAH